MSDTPKPKAASRKRAACLAIIAALVSLPAGAQAIEGRASIVDGDTIDIHRQRIRLTGIDAPESWQICQNKNGNAYKCGEMATRALDIFLSASTPTHCDIVDGDLRGRLVGDCFRADGESVSEWMVRRGYAMDWPRYSHGAYFGQQQAAKKEHLGIWRGEFIRHGRPRNSAAVMTGNESSYSLG